MKVVSVEENGRVNFSIKKATPPPPRAAASPASPVVRKAPSKPLPEEMTFEDKLKEFMQSSDSRISDLKHYNERKTGRAVAGDKSGLSFRSPFRRPFFIRITKKSVQLPSYAAREEVMVIIQAKYIRWSAIPFHVVL